MIQVSKNNFELLCVTMMQTDFSKIIDMNIKANVVFVNQANTTTYKEIEFGDRHIAKMITTETRGVGVNRNLSLLYANATYCLFADDDMRYVDNIEEIITTEFKNIPKADIIIFNVRSTDSQRKQKEYLKTKKHHPWERMPWGAVRIAIKLSSIKKANLWFTTLFGGGCLYPSGEDSMWLIDAKRKGLSIYLSNKFIGEVSFRNSTWYEGANEKYFFGKGAFYQAVHPKMFYFWLLYFSFRTFFSSHLTSREKIKWMLHGKKSYNSLSNFKSFID